MLINDIKYQTIWLDRNDSACVQIIDQRFLPHEFVIEELRSLDDAIVAIRDMHVRGAPLIGATAAWGMYLAAVEGAGSDLSSLQQAGEQLKQARPTAVNLAWAVDRVISAISAGDGDPVEITRSTAESICREDVEICRQIGEHGLALIEEIAFAKQSAAVNILTHCNAGWLAAVDWGTATSPVYHAQQ
ncbi:MAG: S-methyl-5-thioribose-1-phosphate isomerase, partial [Gammaproteobacteria bacterium]|nr:S-methyl-5-thioribose-1-phosphate isomerase [Gammaproteobacteria bacterium]